jgi:ribosomal protein L12E/L44/L45/RPP1/RPP2
LSQLFSFFAFVLTCGSPDEVTVLTPYVGQLLKIREALAAQVLVFVDDRDLDEIRETFGAASAAAAAAGNKAAEPACNGRRPARSARGKDGDEDGAEEGKVDRAGEKSPKVVEDNAKNRVRLATVDNFQGEESIVVVLSLVRNHKQGKVREFVCVYVRARIARASVHAGSEMCLQVCVYESRRVCVLFFRPCRHRPNSFVRRCFTPFTYP